MGRHWSSDGDRSRSLRCGSRNDRTRRAVGGELALVDRTAARGAVVRDAASRRPAGRAAIGTVLVAGGGVEAVSAAAPFALWPGAGDGHGRTPLLRGHPLLRDGVIDGAVFGERIAYANGEVQRWIHSPPSLPMRIAVASFVDLARASRRAPAAPAGPSQSDRGLAVRVQVPGQKCALRTD